MQWVAPVQANDLEVINPSNEQVCALISLGAQADGERCGPGRFQ